MTTELSGAIWASRFPGSVKTRDLLGNFRLAVEDFISAMKDADIKVSINSTLRPIQRSYLMHYSWRIANSGLDPTNIPPMSGVDIIWNHGTKEESVRGSRAMLIGLNINNLKISPALRSKHNSGLAIDMSLTWRKKIEIKDANEKIVTIDTLPRTGINRKLIAVAATYGVKKYNGPGTDDPHWSNNGF